MIFLFDLALPLATTSWNFAPPGKFHPHPHPRTFRKVIIIANATVSSRFKNVTPPLNFFSLHPKKITPLWKCPNSDNSCKSVPFGRAWFFLVDFEQLKIRWNKESSRVKLFKNMWLFVVRNYGNFRYINFRLLRRWNFCRIFYFLLD